MRAGREHHLVKSMRRASARCLRAKAGPGNIRPVGVRPYPRWPAGALPARCVVATTPLFSGARLSWAVVAQVLGSRDLYAFLPAPGVRGVGAGKVVSAWMWLGDDSAAQMARTCSRCPWVAQPGRPPGGDRAADLGGGQAGAGGVGELPEPEGRAHEGVVAAFLPAKHKQAAALPGFGWSPRSRQRALDAAVLHAKPDCARGPNGTSVARREKFGYLLDLNGAGYETPRRLRRARRQQRDEPVLPVQQGHSRHRVQLRYPGPARDQAACGERHTVPVHAGSESQRLGKPRSRAPAQRLFRRHNRLAPSPAQGIPPPRPAPERRRCRTPGCGQVSLNGRPGRNPAVRQRHN